MISFDVDGRAARGFLAEPGGEGKYPGLIVVHEWWGLNDHIKSVVERFSSEGFVTIAPDLYDGRVTKEAEEAGRYMQELDQDYAVHTLNAAVSFLQSNDMVNADKIGVTGFCMGGSFALLLPCRNGNIKASAPFYGEVPSEADLASLSAPVLFIGAENDFWITKEKIERLREGAEKFKKDVQIKIYPDVGHAFFNDSRPEAYDKNSAEDAWARVNDFFAERLK